MTRKLIAVAIAVAACTPNAGDTTTTSVQAPTTTLIVTTTNAPTTTLPPTTTSTTLPPTTTTTLPPTTTTTLLEGNWGAQPLIIARMGALGWWDGSEWVDAQDEGALPVVGGETYQIAHIDVEDAIVYGEVPTTLCEPFINNIGINVDQPDLLGEWPGPAGVAISAPWELQPHLFEAINDDGTYAQFAKELLANRGLNVDNPVIKQLYRLDIEGDGINEVLAVAEDTSNQFLTTNGDYSIVFLRKVVQGEVATAVLESTVITDAENQWYVGYTIGAVADLNNDGKMEMVINSADLEGFGVAVWEYANDDLGPIMLFQTGCGA